MPVLLIALAIYVPMIFEALRASRNEREQRARGGIEPPDDVYKMMRVAYPTSFLAMLVEGALRGAPGSFFSGAIDAPPGAIDAPLVAGATLFVLAKALKWWAILTLGPSWTFRVIVVPGMPLVASGPYRWMRHPNYVGVVGELGGAALMTGALIAGPVAAAGFIALLSKRIAVESRVLQQATRGT